MDIHSVETATYQKTTLDNGLRVLTASIPHSLSVAISIFIGTGSRYEDDQEAGISHFVEHMCFKGTERRPTSKEISEAIDSLGGLLNGATDREMTVFWCKVARPHFSLGMDILLDILHHSKFDADEIEKERQVIIEELNMAQDSHYDRVSQMMDQLLWPNHPLGRDVAGNKETVRGIDRGMLLDYHGQHYTAPNVVISVAGAITQREVLEALAPSVQLWKDGAPRPWHPVDSLGEHNRLSVEWRKIEQAQISLSLPGLSLHHPDRYIMGALNIILGEGMSSRLFLELRERHGLVYDIHSYVSHLKDTGAMTINAGVDPKKAPMAVELIIQELHRLRNGIAPEELIKAKELSKGRFLLRMEDNRSVSGWMGTQELLVGRINTIDDVLSIVDSITLEDVTRVAQEIIKPEELLLAVLGPFRSEKAFARLLSP